MKKRYIFAVALVLSLVAYFTFLNDFDSGDQKAVVKNKKQKSSNEKKLAHSSHEHPDTNNIKKEEKGKNKSRLASVTKSFYEVGEGASDAAEKNMQDFFAEPDKAYNEIKKDWSQLGAQEHSQKAELVYLMGKSSDKRFAPLLKEAVLNPDSETRRQLKEEGPHSPKPSAYYNYKMMSFESLLNLSDKETQDDLFKNIFAKCDKGSFCFSAVRKALKLGYKEQEILSMLPKSFNSIYF